MPTKESVSSTQSARRFWTRREAGESYDRDFTSVIGWYTNESELRPVLALLKNRGNQKILDVGCGTGRYVERISGGNQVTGIDLSPSMLGAAAGRAPEASFAASSAVCLPFADETFDVVYSVRVIQHIRDQERMIEEMTRVCKKGGRVILLAYNSWSFLNLYKQIRMSRAGRILNVPFKLLLGRRSFLNPWGFEYDNYCSIPEIQGWMRRCHLRAGPAWGVTTAMPWFLNDFFIGKVIEKIVPALLKVFLRFFLILDATLARRFPFKYFTDKVLVCGEKRA